MDAFTVFWNYFVKTWCVRYKPGIILILVVLIIFMYSLLCCMNIFLSSFRGLEHFVVTRSP